MHYIKKNSNLRKKQRNSLSLFGFWFFYLFYKYGDTFFSFGIRFLLLFFENLFFPQATFSINFWVPWHVPFPHAASIFPVDTHILWSTPLKYTVYHPSTILLLYLAYIDNFFF